MTAALRQLPAGGIALKTGWTTMAPARSASRSASPCVSRAATRVVDFTGTSAQVAGGINANYAVTVAAVLYVFQGLAGADIPANAGLLRPVRIIAPSARW